MLDPREIAPETLRPLSRAEYERMVEMGLFDDERVELLYGAIVHMSPHGPEHDSALQRLTELLVRQVAGRAHVRIQSGFAASDGSEPEPDAAVVPLGDYSTEHPARALLIVEVASTSLSKDRGPKARLYAEAGVPEYWIVNLVERVVEVHTEARDGLYRKTARYLPGETIAMRELAGVEIDAGAVLPAR